MLQFALPQGLGDDAINLPPRGKRGIGHHTHQPGTATAIDHAQATQANGSTGGGGECRMRRVAPRRGATKYANRLHRPQPRLGTMTVASPSITGLPATVQVVLRVTRFLAGSRAVISTVAVTVSPILTGARNLRFCDR